jgi:hypothetical protein
MDNEKWLMYLVKIVFTMLTPKVMCRVQMLSTEMQFLVEKQLRQLSTESPYFSRPWKSFCYVEQPSPTEHQRSEIENTLIIAHPNHCTWRLFWAWKSSMQFPQFEILADVVPPMHGYDIINCFDSNLQHLSICRFDFCTFRVAYDGDETNSSVMNLFVMLPTGHNVLFSKRLAVNHFFIDTSDIYNNVYFNCKSLKSIFITADDNFDHKSLEATLEIHSLQALMLDSFSHFNWKYVEVFSSSSNHLVNLIDLTLANLKFAEETMIVSLLTGTKVLQKVRLIKIPCLTDWALEAIGSFFRETVNFYIMLFALHNISAIGIENMRILLHSSGTVVCHNCCEEGEECPLPWTRWPTWDESDLKQTFSKHYTDVNEDLESFYSRERSAEMELEPVDIRDAEPWHFMCDSLL